MKQTTAQVLIVLLLIRTAARRQLSQGGASSLLIGAILALAGTGLPSAMAQTASSFDFIFPIDNFPGYSPDEMVQNCGGTYLGASASARFEFGEGRSRVAFQLANAAPSTLYTVWLRLGPDGSPLTGGGSTPLADPSEIPALGAVTPAANLTALAQSAQLTGDDGTGSASVANGFVTDASGNGQLILDLSFSLLEGVYPFSQWNPDIADMPLGNQPFALRIVSHCVDQVGHGLAPGKREAWFDLVTIPEPTGTGWLLLAGLPAARRRAGRGGGHRQETR